MQSVPELPKKIVATCGAEDPVVSLTTDNDVGRRQDDDVLCRAAAQTAEWGKDVAAAQLVITWAAVDAVEFRSLWDARIAVAPDPVVAFVTAEDVVGAHPSYVVISSAASEDVVTRRTHDDVVTGCRCICRMHAETVRYMTALCRGWDDQERRKPDDGYRERRSHTPTPSVVCFEAFDNAPIGPGRGILL